MEDVSRISNELLLCILVVSRVVGLSVRYPDRAFTPFNCLLRLNKTGGTDTCEPVEGNQEAGGISTPPSAISSPPITPIMVEKKSFSSRMRLIFLVGLEGEVFMARVMERDDFLFIDPQVGSTSCRSNA